MPGLFSVASWNVEHFNDDPARVANVAGFIAGEQGGPPQLPDIFVLYEVEGKDLFHEFMKRFPDYCFHITEGKQSQEIFIGVHRRLQSFSTQRMEFKTQRDYQRPGLLLSVRVDDVYFSLLFLHVRSGSNTEDFGLRDAAINHAFNLKKALDAAAGDAANFIIVGDLNTMGIDDPVPYSKILDISSDREVDRLSDWAGRRDMVLLHKDPLTIEGADRQATWYNGSKSYEPSNLDHVIASEHMDIRNAAGVRSRVSVYGWPGLPRDLWRDWFDRYSDHALLYFEVWG